MKIIPLAVFLLFAHMQLSFAPENNILTIPASEPIKVMPIITTDYDRLIDAIFTYESGRNPNAYNKLEDAVGGLQIRQCRVDHYNQLTGKNYTLNDMYDFNKAKEVFLLFAKGKTYEHAAKDWNGSGPLTIKYWSNVRVLLNT